MVTDERYVPQFTEYYEKYMFNENIKYSISCKFYINNGLSFILSFKTFESLMEHLYIILVFCNIDHIYIQYVIQSSIENKIMSNDFYLNANSSIFRDIWDWLKTECNVEVTEYNQSELYQEE